MYTLAPNVFSRGLYASPLHLSSCSFHPSQIPLPPPTTAPEAEVNGATKHFQIAETASGEFYFGEQVSPLPHGRRWQATSLSGVGRLHRCEVGSGWGALKSHATIPEGRVRDHCSARRTAMQGPPTDAPPRPPPGRPAAAPTRPAAAVPDFFRDDSEGEAEPPLPTRPPASPEQVLEPALLEQRRV